MTTAVDWGIKPHTKQTKVNLMGYKSGDEINALIQCIIQPYWVSDDEIDILPGRIVQSVMCLTAGPVPYFCGD